MRILVLGAGRMGGHHARMLARQPETRQLLIADVHEGRAQLLAAEVGATAIPRDAAQPGALEVDWVIVATPTSRHGEAQAWAEAGAHVLVEKPLAGDLATASQLQHPRIVVGHTERHNPAFLAVQVTAPLTVHARRLVDRPMSTALGRDVVFDLMVHDLDLLEEVVTGPLRVVEVQGDPLRHVVATLHADGTTATLEAGLVSTVDAERSWTGRDTKGSFQVDLGGEGATRNGEPVPVPASDALSAQWRAARAGQGARASEALRTLELATAILIRLRDPTDSVERQHVP